MKFRTEINPVKSSQEIRHYEKIVTIGSCFAENIANYFSYYKFNVLENPFGVLYNPISILNAINILKTRKLFSKEDLINDQGEWHSFYHHSDFSHHDNDTCLDIINKNTVTSGEFIRNASILIITLGTSFVYKHKENNVIVSNCHKLPSSQFEHFMLTPEETTFSIEQIIASAREMNPDIRIIFTVSPVRHWKNGAIRDKLSKSNLIVSIHETISQHSAVEYFPSYEIMMDDLRDYRFYDEDLLHPNKIATDYIWDFFEKTYFSDNTKQLLNDIGQVIRGVNHRPRNEKSAKHKEFCKNILEKIQVIENKFPHVNFEKEKKTLIIE